VEPLHLKGIEAHKARHNDVPKMTLRPNDRFGSYVVLGLIGAGAMGEVYRARDTRLGRDVALKILPDAMRLDRESVARVEHEARALASLNHHGIAAIYGIEEDRIRDASEPVQALVLEFVAGNTLAERISPDGRWLAYESDASGRMEIYLCSYPDVTKSCVPVTTTGAGAPRWLPATGRQLFFVTLEGALMRVSVGLTGATVQFGTPTKVLDLTGWNAYGSYDIARDGRVVVIKQALTPLEVNVVLNWNLELARQVPAK
jgi:hypothetical protein